MAKKKAPAKKTAAPAADKRIALLRREIKEALSESQFAGMSEAFRKSVAERMGMEKVGPGNVLETKLSAARMARPYYNIYRYRFW